MAGCRRPPAARRTSWTSPPSMWMPAGDGHECVGVALAVADLDVGGVRGSRGGRHQDGGDELVRSEDGLPARACGRVADRVHRSECCGRRRFQSARRRPTGRPACRTDGSRCRTNWCRGWRARGCAPRWPGSRNRPRACCRRMQRHESRGSACAAGRLPAHRAEVAGSAARRRRAGHGRSRAIDGEPRGVRPPAPWSRAPGSRSESPATVTGCLAATSRLRRCVGWMTPLRSNCTMSVPPAIAMLPGWAGLAAGSMRNGCISPLSTWLSRSARWPAASRTAATMFG